MKSFYLILEKALATYVEFLIGLWLADQMDTLHTNTPQQLAIAAIPAFLTVIASGMPAISATLPFYVGLVLNVVRTFAASFIGYLVALPVFVLDASVGKAALVAALPSALAVLKAALASRIGDGTTPNLLPAELDPQATSIAA